VISYRPLKDLLYHNDILIKELVEAKILTPTNSVYVNNNSGHLNLRTINRVGNYLSKRLNRPIKINDILEFIPDVPTSKDQQQQTTDN